MLAKFKIYQHKKHSVHSHAKSESANISDSTVRNEERELRLRFILKTYLNYEDKQKCSGRQIGFEKHDYGELRIF